MSKHTPDKYKSVARSAMESRKRHKADADALRALNAELLEALKELEARATDAGNTLSKMGQGATLLGMASKRAREIIAKAEGVEK